MITGKEDLLQALMEAYLMEKGTKEFYSIASDGVKDSEAARVFRELSLWEEKHMEYIRSLYQSVMEDYDFIGFNEFSSKTEASHTESGIPVKDMLSGLEEYHIIGDMDALTIAFKMEGRAYNLYRKLSEETADTNAKVVFDEMMRQELKHIDYLKNIKKRLEECNRPQEAK
jgi:rubrerythrin